MTENKRGEGSSEAPTPEGSGSISMKYALELARRRMVFPSGSEGLDRLLGGGFRTGESVEIFGSSNSGKTQAAMQATLSPVSMGHSAAFVDTEGTFRPERLAKMAEARGMDPDLVLSRVFVVRAGTTTQQMEALNSVRKLEGCRMMVVDTVTKNFTLEYGGAVMAPRRQAALAAYLNRLNWDALAHDRAVVLTNRVASVPTQGAALGFRDVPIGGETMSRSVQKVLRFERTDGEIRVTLLGRENKGADAVITAVGLE